MRKSLQIKIEILRHRWPLFAVGIVGGNEFVLLLWLVAIRIEWLY